MIWKTFRGASYTTGEPGQCFEELAHKYCQNLVEVLGDQTRKAHYMKVFSNGFYVRFLSMKLGSYVMELYGAMA